MDTNLSKRLESSFNKIIASNQIHEGWYICTALPIKLSIQIAMAFHKINYREQGPLSHG